MKKLCHLGMKFCWRKHWYKNNVICFSWVRIEIRQKSLVVLHKYVHILDFQPQNVYHAIKIKNQHFYEILKDQLYVLTTYLLNKLVNYFLSIGTLLPSKQQQVCNFICKNANNLTCLVQTSPVFFHHLLYNICTVPFSCNSRIARDK